MYCLYCVYCMCRIKSNMLLLRVIIGRRLLLLLLRRYIHFVFMPYIDFRFRTCFKSINILSMRPQQQKCYCKSKENKRKRYISNTRPLRRRVDNHKQRKTTARSHRSQRNIVRSQEDKHPNRKTQKYDLRIDTRYSSHQRCYTLTALKIGENRKNVPEHSGKYSQNFEIDKPRLANIGILAHYAK